jgi:hypothetical protein
MVVINELKTRLYNRSTFIICEFLYTAPVATLTFVAFAYPACTLAGQKPNVEVFMFLLAGNCNNYLINYINFQFLQFAFFFRLFAHNEAACHRGQLVLQPQKSSFDCVFDSLRDFAVHRRN